MREHPAILFARAIVTVTTLACSSAFVVSPHVVGRGVAQKFVAATNQLGASTTPPRFMCRCSLRRRHGGIAAATPKSRPTESVMLSAGEGEKGKFFKMGGAEDTQSYGPR